MSNKHSDLNCRFTAMAPVKKVKVVNGFTRLLSASRMPQTSIKRKAWRHHKVRVKIKRTPAEKAEQKHKRLEAKLTYHEALEHCRKVIKDQAKALREQFGLHSVQYYKEEIMQHSRFDKKRKEAGRWQAFVSKETRAINNGLVPVCLCVLLY